MAIDTLAMANYPYPSDYITSPGLLLPPWPLHAACQHLMGGGGPGEEGKEGGEEGKEGGGAKISMARRLLLASNVLYNVSGTLPCLSLPEDDTYDGIWDYQWCTETLPQESYFARDGGSRDAFPAAHWSAEEVDAHCTRKYNVTPRRGWIAALYGGAEGLRKGASNIAFSNGGMDPWSSGGVLHSLSPSLPSLFIPQGAHHLDLFFSHPADPPSVVQGRGGEGRAGARRGAPTHGIMARTAPPRDPRPTPRDPLSGARDRDSGARDRGFGARD